MLYPMFYFSADIGYLQVKRQGQRAALVDTNHDQSFIHVPPQTRRSCTTSLIKVVKNVWYHSITVGGGALSGVWWPLTWPQALFQAEGLGVEPISISSTASIQELCTDPVHSVKEPFSLIAPARHSGIIVKSAWICKVINGNMQHQRDNSNHQRQRLC